VCVRVREKENKREDRLLNKPTNSDKQIDHLSIFITEAPFMSLPLAA
jgi:hypothetical protein